MFQLLTIIMMINVDWGDYTDPIYDMFMGNESQGLTGIFAGDSYLLAAFIFIIFLILTLIFGLGMLVGSVILLPASFAIFDLVPSMRVIIAIMCGLIFGLGLHRLVRR